MNGGRPAEAAAEVRVGEGGTVRLSGLWTMKGIEGLVARPEGLVPPAGGNGDWDAGGILAMDTAGAWVLHRMLGEARVAGPVPPSLRGLRPHHAELLDMVAEAGKNRDVPGPDPGPGLLERMGRRAVADFRAEGDALAFVGESVTALAGWVLRPGRVRRRAILHVLEADGFRALPIIGLLAFLMGVVIAYQAAEQLKPFGADIFIVDFVGIAILREIAPLVTAIIVAGRSGASYAAQIGTMKVNEEVDALVTLGVPPVEPLVLPRVLALSLALPLLTVFADVLGVLGGMIIAESRLNIGLAEFLTRFRDVVPVRHYLVGVGKAPVFAVLIALVGCYQGFRVSGGADAVGRRTTISVVQGIFLVIVSDALFSVLFDLVGLGL